MSMPEFRSFEAEVFIPAPPSAVFAFHQSPFNIPKITGAFPRLEVRRAEPVAHPGGTFDLLIDLGLFSLLWKGRWIEVQQDTLLADTTDLSPFEYFRHEHYFMAIDGGTQMVDRLQFSLGGSWLDRSLEIAALAAVLPAAFRDRQKRTVQWFQQADLDSAV